MTIQSTLNNILNNAMGGDKTHRNGDVSNRGDGNNNKTYNIRDNNDTDAINQRNRA